ncbi:MAG: tRNA (guanosine(46)-N7)-methyltransferase TrmB [Gammaproteobacteria bacterium]
MLRKIRSYVRREGRITPGQQLAFDEHWESFAIPFPATPDWSMVFNRDAPLVVDIGFGNGESVVALAQAHPEWNIIGIEVYRPGVGYLFRQLQEKQITNVRVICHDAVEVLQSAFAPQSLSRVQIFFPDPWPKKRHHKRRLIQPAFVALLAERLKETGVLALATDWQDYAEHMITVLSAETLLENRAATFSPRDEVRPLTKFECRGQHAGHEIWELNFTKR